MIKGEWKIDLPGMSEKKRAKWSTRIQEIVFDNGGSWNSGDKEVLYTYCPYLYVTYNRLLKDDGDQEKIFNEDDNTLITAKKFCKKFGKKEVQPEDMPVGPVKGKVMVMVRDTACKEWQGPYRLIERNSDDYSYPYVVWEETRQEIYKYAKLYKKVICPKCGHEVKND